MPLSHRISVFYQYCSIDHVVGNWRITEHGNRFPSLLARKAFLRCFLLNCCFIAKLHRVYSALLEPLHQSKLERRKQLRHIKQHKHTSVTTPATGKAVPKAQRPFQDFETMTGSVPVTPAVSVPSTSYSNFQLKQCSAKLLVLFSPTAVCLLFGLCNFYFAFSTAQSECRYSVPSWRSFLEVLCDSCESVRKEVQ